jgi:hypothetical protein
MAYEPITISKALNLIDSDGFDSWKQHLFQFVDDFRRAADPSALVAEKPDSVFPRVEALAASTAHRLCVERGVSVPEWISEVPPLPTPWFVSGFKSMRAMDLVESPCSFKIRNVFVPGDFLARV